MPTTCLAEFQALGFIDEQDKIPALVRLHILVEGSRQYICT